MNTGSKAPVKMYTSSYCPFCMRAEQLLEQRGVQDIERISVDGQPEVKQQMIEITGRRTVPQIYIGATHVGGFDDLAQADREGRLTQLLNPVS